GLTGGGDLSADRTLAFDYTATLAGNPTLTAGQCVFSNDTTGTNKGGLICEGATADVNETYIGVAEPTADRTITFPDASGTVPLGTGTSGTLTKWTGTNTVGNATCTESGGVISGCTAPAAPHRLLSAQHADTNSSAVVKGDLVVGNSTPKWDRLPVGTNGQVPIADSAQSLGVRWGTPSANQSWTQQVGSGAGT